MKTENGSERTQSYDIFDDNPRESEKEGTARKKGYLATNIVKRVLKHKQFLNLQNGQFKIAEIGPGKGTLQELFKEIGLESLSIEVCQAYANNLKNRNFECIHTNDVYSALEEMVLNGKKIQCVVAIDVLEHMPLEDSLRLLRSVKNSLQSQGVLILQVPNVSGVFGISTFAADPTHVMLYNEHSLLKLLTAAGFKNVKCHEMILPKGKLNTLRSCLRTCIFYFLRLLQKIVGATPTRIMTHNIVVTAES
jgi:2-polyprenyl-3-methyl-5-hydroxy-6-metoxy-1,4-benzoquinol methylase